MPHLLGVDLGTSYFKVGVFNETGALLGLNRLPLRAESPAPGRFEVDVTEFWRLLREGVAGALRQAGLSPHEVAGLSYSSQANTFVLLDRADRPLTPLVLWTDNRGDPLPEGLAAITRTEGYGRRIGFTGMTGGWAPAKWRWFRENRRDVWTEARRLQTISDYFTYALTGEAVGDAGTASLLGLYDLTAGDWWPAALNAFELDAAKLSRPLPPGKMCGRTSAAATERIGLPAGIPFAVGSLDHHMAALGSGLGRLADVSISTGTVLAAMTRVPEVLPLPGCYHGPDFRTGFYRLTFDPKGAGQLEAFQREHAPDLSVEQLVGLAAQAPAGQTRASLGKPTSREAQGRHVRYLLEKIAAAQRALVKHAVGDAPIQRVVATGGGARSELWLQIKADMLGVPVTAPASPERACLGAAMVAAVAANLYRDLDEASAAMVHPGRTYEPNPAAVRAYAQWEG
jgi:xylulokinase